MAGIDFFLKPDAFLNFFAAGGLEDSLGAGYGKGRQHGKARRLGGNDIVEVLILNDARDEAVMMAPAPQRGVRASATEGSEKRA